MHESIIGSTFSGRIEARAKVGKLDAIIPSIEGWARVTGQNTIVVDDRDPFWQGFSVADQGIERHKPGPMASRSTERRRQGGP